MPNPFFQFKKFIVHQDMCAMKVCTDSCLFGAWTTDWLLRNQINANHILDIGAGTSLLSLMLAQKFHDAKLDAVEIDALSAQQAKENFIQSHWQERLHLFQSDIQTFSFRNKYDFIISNPPFYENDLRSENKVKNIAHHNTGLTLQELIISVKRLLSAGGIFAVLLPYHRTNEFEQLANKAGFSLHTKTCVQQTAKHSYFRSMCLFSGIKKICVANEISIKDERNNYTPAFIDLLKDYYLYL